MALLELSGIARELKRIADALERLSPVVPVEDPAATEVKWTSDEEHAEQERAREAYRRVSGRKVFEWEDPPGHVAPDGTPWR